MKSRGFKRIWGKPWDYAYLLLLEQRKLKEMAAYFQKSQLTVGWEFQVRDCELCVKLIDIILENGMDCKNTKTSTLSSFKRAIFIYIVLMIQQIM